MDFLNNLIATIQERLDRLSDQQKRIVLAAGLIIASLFIGFIIYWVFFRSLITPPVSEDNANATINGQLPDIIKNQNGAPETNVNEVTELPQIDTVAQGEATLAEVIYNDQAQNAVLSDDGANVQFYDPETGKFYKIDVNGQVIALSDKIFKGVQNATWSHDTTKAVLELIDGYKVLYDFEKDQQYTLNKDMAEFDFSPNDTQISFKFLSENSEDRWLGVANIDGSGAIGIERLGENADQVNAQWSPTGQSAAMYIEPVTDTTAEVYPIGFRGENLKKFTVEGKGFDYHWTPNGKQMIYSTYTLENNYNPTLHIVDAYGEAIGANNTNLQLSTSVDKCSFNQSGNSVYCAVPVNPPTGSGIAPEVLDNVPSDIYKINLQTGVTEKIATPADTQSGAAIKGASKLMVSDNEAVLYYTEATTGKLRRVLLK